VDTDSKEWDATIVGHFDRIRHEPIYATALLVITYESNSGWDRCDRMQNTLRKTGRMGPMYLVSRDRTGENRPGVWTDHVGKEQGKSLLSDELKQGNMCYAAKFITAPHSLDNVSSLSSGPKPWIQTELELQLRNYKKKLRPAADPDFSHAKYAYSGKASGLRDDLCSSLTQQLYVIRLMRNDTAFVQHCERAHYHVF
jgi:hypothetical protein